MNASKPNSAYPAFKLALLVGLWFGLGVASPAHPAYEARLLAGDTAPYVLTPEGLVQWVVLRNAAVLVAQDTIEMAHWQVQNETAAYQPEFFLTLGRSGEMRQSGLDAEPSTITDRETLLESGVRTLFPTGTELTFGYESRDRFNTAPSGTDPEGIDDVVGNFTLQIRQPLWRGFGAQTVRSRIAQAELEIEVAQQNLRQTLLATSFDALNLFWQLYNAEQALTNTQHALTTIEDLLVDTERQVMAGRLPQTALLEVRSNLISREIAVDNARQQHHRVVSALRLLLNLDAHEYGHIEFQTHSIPAQNLWTPPANPEAYFASVLSTWPNFRIAQERLQQSRQSVLLAEDQSRPQLDLILDYGQSARDFDSRFGRVFGDALRNDYPSWGIRAVLAVPLGPNQSGQASRALAQLELQQAQLQTSLVRTQLFEELQLRQSQLTQTWENYQRIQAQVAIQEELLQIERQRFELGASSVRELLAQESALTLAQLRLADAEQDLELATITLQLADGSLLREMGVDFNLVLQERQ